MKNHVKHDNITVNLITPPNDVKVTSRKPTENAQNNAFCVYAGMRHAVGSIINHDDGSKSVCTEDGSWQNS